MPTMNSNCRLAIPLFLALILPGVTATSWGAEELKPFKVFVAAGANSGTEVDYVTQRKDQTTIYLFVAANDWARPVASYVRKLDKEIAAGVPGGEDAAIVVVWLSDNAAKGKEYLPKAQMSLNLVRTDWTVFEGQKAGPDNWNVDIASSLTTVVTRGGKEIGRIRYKSVNEIDVPEALKLLKK